MLKPGARIDEPHLSALEYFYGISLQLPGFQRGKGEENYLPILYLFDVVRWWALQRVTHVPLACQP